MPTSKAMEVARQIDDVILAGINKPPEILHEQIATLIDQHTAQLVQEARLEGARVMQAAAASELVNQHASAEIDGYQAAATVDALDPQQVINESMVK